jgi:hypothetical protein
MLKVRCGDRLAGEARTVWLVRWLSRDRGARRPWSGGSPAVWHRKRGDPPRNRCFEIERDPTPSGQSCGEG